MFKLFSGKRWQSTFEILWPDFIKGLISTTFFSIAWLIAKFHQFI